MSKVLISGAAGFLGNNLSRFYLSQGIEVVGIDDFSTAMTRKSQHIVELESNKNFRLIEGSINDAMLLNDLKTVKFDLIFNLACPASPPRYAALPIHTLMTCVQGTKNLLDFANYHGAIIVHASTSEVYGDPAISPQPEEYWGNVNSFGARSCYDEGKRCAEALCYSYLHAGTDVRIVRIFNTYGPFLDPDDGRVVTNFIKQAITGEPLTIYGNGNQTRSFCYVSDMISGFHKLATIKKNPRMPINIGNPNEFTIDQLALIVLELIPHTGTKIVFKPLPSDDPTQRKPDVTLAKKILNWKPKIQLQEGLEKTIPWVKEALAFCS